MIQKVGAWVMIGGLSLLPVFFLPVTQDNFDTNKWMLLVVATLVLLVVWGLRVLTTGTLAITWNGTTKRLGLVALAALASLFVSPNKVEALLHPLGAGTFLALFLVAIIGASFLDDKARHILRWILMTAASLAGLLAMYQFFGLGNDPLWTPVGTSTGLMTILAVTVPLMIEEALHRRRAGHDNHVIVAAVMGIASLGGLIFTAYQALPRWGTTSLAYWANWQILLESYKNWKSLLVGVGAENFLAAFTAGRPAALNATSVWNTRFTLGSSMLLHIATVYGVVGAAAFLYFLGGMVLKRLNLASLQGLTLTRVSLLLSALSLIFLPPSFPALIVIILLLMLDEAPSLKRRGLSRLNLRYGLALIVLLLTAAATYGLFRAYGAELAFASSLTALENRDGTGAYNAQIQAITRNPQVTRFHTAYSQTNLALANALAGTATSSATPDELDRDRQTTTQLIQQAIREAKIGVNLAPTNILAWENIANVYQSLTGVAQGADQWTVAAYSQAMQLDPTNPVIRLRLGGAYVGQQKLDLAAESYAAAIALKPDYANAYYNLAFVYRQQKKYLPAAQSLKESLTYVTSSEDTSRAQKELDELRELLTEEEKRALDEAVTTGADQTPATPASPSKDSEPLSPLP